MKTQIDYIELYTDYLISGNGYATATGLSSMLDGEHGRFMLEHYLLKAKIWKGLI